MLVNKDSGGSFENESCDHSRIFDPNDLKYSNLNLKKRKYKESKRVKQNARYKEWLHLRVISWKISSI